MVFYPLLFQVLYPAYARVKMNVVIVRQMLRILDSGVTTYLFYCPSRQNLR